MVIVFSIYSVLVFGQREIGKGYIADVRMWMFLIQIYDILTVYTNKLGR